MRKWSLVFLILFGLPLLGFATAIGIETDFEARYAESILVLNNPTWSDTLGEACARPSYRTAAPFECEILDELALLKAGSLLVGAVSLGLLAFIGLLGFAAGRHRPALALGFRLGLFLLLPGLAVLMLGQAAIAAGAAIELERVYLGTFNLFVVGAVALGGIMGAGRLLAAGLAAARPPIATPIAAPRPDGAQPRLRALIDGIASATGARAPDHILLGLGTDFYATALPLRPAGRETLLTGETLHLSLPLMRVLSAEDLAGIVAHELAHFRGGDTAYTLRFLPIHAGVTRALAALEAEAGWGRLAALPAIVLLGFFLSCFSGAMGRLGRERELLADRVGAGLHGSEVMARALLRASAFSLLWKHAEQAKIEAIGRNEPLGNLSAHFQDLVRRWTATLDRPALIGALAAMTLGHPTDTHPTFSERLEALGQSAEGRVAWLDPAEAPASALIEGLLPLEEALTGTFTQVCLAHGFAKPPAKKPAIPAAPRSRLRRGF